MGIVIVVASIITPESRRRPGPKQILLNQQRQIGMLCEAFGWEKPPWDEPSEQKGLYTSANYSRYALLLHLAKVAQQPSEESLYLNDTILDLATHVEADRLMPSQNQDIYADQHIRFPHLLDHDLYETLYIPVDLDRPQYIQGEGIGGNDRMSVGSSIKLAEEMAILIRLTNRIVELKGGKSVVQSNAGIPHNWDGVHDMALTFQQAARESMELNLPISVPW